jgi:hypothetical protein
MAQMLELLLLQPVNTLRLCHRFCRLASPAAAAAAEFISLCPAAEATAAMLACTGGSIL